MDIVKVLVGVVIFTALIGTIATQIAAANVTGTTATIVALTPLFVGIGFLTWILKVTKVQKGR